ncbi:hypothetical protein E2F47_22175 [Mycobacterium eburneum]|nr:hypothetical protein [Mycobacterium eburneum]TDH48875.1 hypothetical protein E2F47_22175 [Mycobacterium eburneum]
MTPQELLKTMLPANARQAWEQQAAKASPNYTVEQAMHWMSNIAAAVNRTPRLPIHVDATTDPDGALILRVTPDRADP